MPIFQVSCVSGVGLAELKRHLFQLSTHAKRWDEQRLQSVEIRVLEQYRFEADEDEDCCSSFEFKMERKKRSRSFERGSNSAVIVLGSIKAGAVSLADVLLYGPDKTGAFMPVTVASIQINRIPVKSATAGQCATLLLRRAKERSSSFEDYLESSVSPRRAGPSDLSSPRNTTRETSSTSLDVFALEERSSRLMEDDEWTEEDDQGLTEIWEKRVGMVLVSPLSSPSAAWVFTAELLILNHPSLIRVNYEPVVHAENVMQSARLVSISSVVRKPRSPSMGTAAEDAAVEGLSVGDRALCKFKFLYQPEYILAGAAIVIREGRTRGVGRVVEIHGG